MLLLTKDPPHYSQLLFLTDWDRASIISSRSLVTSRFVGFVFSLSLPFVHWLAIGKISLIPDSIMSQPLTSGSLKMTHPPTSKNFLELSFKTGFKFIYYSVCGLVIVSRLKMWLVKTSSVVCGMTQLFIAVSCFV